ncbi:MAG: hypothetical protein PHF86_06105 [Candidatus Nanoarchaeia archaeon]|nr:hypothetical protein [Candidatus Nanoarchaeia archaeon]
MVSNKFAKLASERTSGFESPSLRILIKQGDWFKALLMYLAAGFGNFKSFMNKYDVKGYEKEIKQVYKEIRRQSTISKDWWVQPKKYRRLMGYQILADRIFKDNPIRIKVYEHITFDVVHN